MTVGERWVRRPQSVWLRKAVFQVHLWAGLILGLYVLAISVSGSAIVYRNALFKKLSNPPKLFEPSGALLTHDQIKRAAQRAYPDYVVAYIWPGRKPNQAVEIWMRRGNKQKQRLFNPYTGADVGPSVPEGIKVISWLADLHINLLAGKPGRAINGIGAGFLTLLCLTGAVIWWPGIDSWRRSLRIDRRANWKRFNWDLHSAFGAWTFLFIFMWGITGVVLVFPIPFQNLVAHFTPINQPFYRRQPVAIGDKILRWPAYLHFGNRWGWPLETLWVILGLVPVLLLVTGVIMWWNRVLSPALKRRPEREAIAAQTTTAVEVRL